MVTTPRGQVEVDAPDPRGRTPLHLAVTLGHLECVQVLLLHGADVSKENSNGWTGALEGGGGQGGV